MNPVTLFVTAHSVPKEPAWVVSTHKGKHMSQWNSIIPSQGETVFHTFPSLDLQLRFGTSDFQTDEGAIFQ